ncbi:unnamed protein product [Lactuca saligna]|uniref:Uncharacterized protein n=1 Tax=Lactuca saligna TaxID=75948 RepID=A0AA35ZWS8_LACSI|nr:unnamed protein product [Lactuca saligna]
MDFWRNAEVKKNDRGEKFLETTIKEKRILVTESIIRESLQIEDRPEYLMEIEVHQIEKVLEHMGYKGTFPPTIKKMLPPCWKLLAHVFVSCVSGWRSGANEISLANSGAIAALAASFEFNFSKFIMNEMILNIEGSKIDKFCMYPRFLQIILNVTHPELQRGNDTLDFKSIGPSAYELMKQKRGGKFVFEGKFPLIKFGIFKEDVREEPKERRKFVFEGKFPLINFGIFKEDVREEPVDQSMLMENEDTHHSPSDPVVEEIHHSPTACVAEEHDYQKANDSISSMMIFMNIRANKVNEVASLATKTRDEGNSLKIMLSTSKPLEITRSQGDVTSEIPPSVSPVSTSTPVISMLPEPQTSQISIRTSQSLESLEVPSVKCAPQVISTITTTTAHSPSKQTDEGPSTMFKTGGSSSIQEYSPTRSSLDEASIRLVKHLAQSSPTSSRGKGISFNEGRMDDEKSSSSDLREEIGILHQQLIEKSIQIDQLYAHIFELKEKDEEKTKQIKDLQTSLGSVLANYFNLKNVLYYAFGEKVKALFQQPHGVVDPPSIQSPLATDDLPVDPPVPRTTTIVDKFEKEPEGSRARIIIKQGRRITKQSEGLLFMKKSNENRKTKDTILTVTDLKKRKFGDEYGDKTGIRMWAFDPVTNLWVVKRKSEATECYKSTHDFNSWTKTDLAELSRAPFHNPSEDPNASNFKRFLDRQVKANFPSMKTAKALYKKDKDVLDPETGEPMKIILCPATKKQKEIPNPQHFHEGYLDDMEFWAYDDETATAAIKFKNREHILRLISAKDLLRFRENDIRTLAHHQIICRKDVMEAAAKEYTAMVATIINGRMWMGSIGRSDLRLFEKPAEEPKE